MSRKKRVGGRKWKPPRPTKSREEIIEQVSKGERVKLTDLPLTIRQLRERSRQMRVIHADEEAERKRRRGHYGTRRKWPKKPGR